MASHKYGEIKYNIGFNVDNQSLQQLKSQLQEISNMTTTKFKSSTNFQGTTQEALKELQRLKQEAQLVEQALEKSFNPVLGVTNITKFSNEVNKMNISKLSQDFAKLGPIGESAFRNLSAGITVTNTHIKQTHKLVNEMAVTFKNTIRYGISSSIFNNFTNSVSKAYDYVKKLDTSLNDIRIVSGQSADQMERFAKQANKAAQSLGSTTLDYTKGALIYYQQGLNDEEVAERTNVTLKMSNILGSSAKEVSDYMTAIWNNFDNGSKSLEYFADVITALGASTASSSEEIAEGLEKFAAIANTVGLSYEYATSALATVVANTRQSADIVGTAFKTLFARIQDLELGKTLDDGTTLGKYAKALESVGINIKNQQGELKSMNEILDEMGKKWQTLSKDQQVALAQNVAGTRQYTQLIALMDNWGDFESNLKTATNATGTLQKQQDVYMDSMEAHLTKLSAASERLMSALIDKKGINSLIDGLTRVITLTSNLIEGIGGGRNALLMLGSIGTQVFSSQIANSLNTTINNLNSASEAAKSFQTILNNIQSKNYNFSKLGETEGTKLQKFIETFGQTSSWISNEQKEQGKDYIEIIQQKLDANQILHDKVVNAIEIFSQLEPLTEEAKNSLKESLFQSEEYNEYAVENVYRNTQRFIEQIQEEQSLLHNLNTDLLPENFNANIQESFAKLEEQVGATGRSLTNIDNLIQDGFSDIISEQDSQQITKIKNDLVSLGKYMEELKKRKFLPVTMEELLELTTRVKSLRTNIIKQTTDVANTIKSKGTEMYTSLNKEAKKHYEETVENNNKMIQETSSKAEIFFQNLENIAELKIFTNLISGFGQLATAINSMANIKNILSNDSLSAWEKALQITTALATSLPMLINGISLITKGWKTASEFMKGLNIGLLARIGLIKVETSALEANTQAVILNNKAKGVSNVTTNVTSKGMSLLTDKTKTLSLSMEKMGGTSISATGALTKLGVSIGSMLPIILGAVAAIAVLGVAIYAIVKAYNADADAAKEAAENAKLAKEAAEKAKQQYDNLASSFEKYNEGVKQLKELTAGTDEYTKALEQANEQAMDLIRNNKSLAKYAKRNGEGLIEFIDNGKILEESRLKSNSLQASADISQILANKASLKSDRTNLLREMGLDQWTKQAQAYTTYSMAASNSLLMPGAVIADQKYFSNYVTDEQLQTILQTISNNNGTLIRQDLEAMEFLNNQEIDALMTNSNKLEELAKSTDELNATNKLLVGESLRSSLENKSDFASRSEAEKNAIAALYGSGIDDSVIDDLEKQAKDKWNHDFAFGWGNENEVHKAYAKLMGYTVTADHWGDTADYYDPNTGEEIKKFSDDAARAALIADYIKKHTADYNTDYYNKISSTVDKINATDIGNQYGADFKTAILKAIASDDKQISLESLFAEIDPTEYERLLEMSPEEWKTVLGLEDVDFEILGLESAEDFQKNFNQALENYHWSAKDAIAASLNKTTDDFDALGIKVDEISSYGEHLMDIAAKADDLSDSLQYDADSALIVARSVMRMNNGIDKLVDNYEEWIDILKKSAKSSEEYSEALNNMQDALADILDTEDNLISDDFIQKHFEDIEKAANGDTEAIDRLHKELAKQIIIEAGTNFGLIESEIDELLNKLNNIEIPDIKVGAYLDEEALNGSYDQFLETMGEIINATHMTVDEANALFGQLGFQANFATEEIPTTQEVPEYITETIDEGTKTENGVTFVRTRTRTYQDGTYKATGKMTAIAMQTDAEGNKTNMPKINGITRKANGSYNNYSKANAGGKAAGKASNSKPDKMDPLETEIDRYHKVNTQITKVDNSLKKLQSQQEKFVGSKLLDNLNKQWSLLNNQIDNYSEKLRIANEEEAELAAQLSGKGVQFNADGTIVNYTESIRAQEAYINSLIANYNSMSKEAQETYKDTVEAAKEDFEKFKTNLDRYDELVSDFIPQLYQNVQDALDKQIEINIQKFNYEITITLDLNQATRDWNEWAKRAMDGIDPEDILGNARARFKDIYSYFNGNGFGDVQEGSGQVRGILDNLYAMDRGENNIYGNNRAKGLEELKNYYTQLMESITGVIELQDELYQAVLDEMDDVQSKFDKQVESYEYLREILNHDLKVIQLTLGEDAYGEIMKFYEMQQDNYQKQLDFQRQQKDFWYAEMQAAEEGSKQWESAREKWQAAVNEFNSILEEGLENAAQKFENAINNIFKNLNNQVTNGMGLDYVNTQWDLINQNADRYLDTINASYGIRELEKKFVDSINSANTVSVQQRLKKLMDEQLSNLKERERITQYDIDRANKLYEIELARIALEEAQRNKSQMRLRRDSQGNYTYQYVADKDAIGEAEDQLSMLYNDLYNFDKERYNGVLNDIYSIWDSYQQAMAEAALINDPQKRAEKELLIQEQYNELMTQAAEDYEVSKFNLEESFFWDWADLNDQRIDAFRNMTETEKDLMLTEMIPTWKNGITEMADLFVGENGFANQTIGAWNNIKDAENTYAKDMEKLETISGQTFEAIVNGEDDSIEKAEQLIKDNEELIKKYGEELQAVKDLYAELEKVLKIRQQEYQVAKNTADEAQKYWAKQQEIAAAEAKKQEQTTNSTKSAEDIANAKANSTSANASSAASAGTAGGDGVPTIGETVTYTGGLYYSSSYGDGPSGNRGPGKKVKITAIANGRAYPIHVMSSDSAYGWLKLDQLRGYDTGGYTGDWDNSGRLALLHQKELVLNAKDTENMLNTVAIMRSLAYSLGTDMLARMAGASAQGYSNGGSGSTPLEQNVHIDAQFPNVRNAAEIEEALNNLVNAASQRIMESR